MDSMHVGRRVTNPMTPPMTDFAAADVATSSYRFSRAESGRVGVPEAAIARLGDQTVRQAPANATTELGL